MVRLMLTAAATVAAVATTPDSCSLFAISHDTCGQSDLECQYVKFAKLADPSLSGGTCKDEGYTVKGGTSTFSCRGCQGGDLTITQYTKSLSVQADTCSLFAISGDTCGQSDLDCKYVQFAKLAEKSLKDGTCKDQGYTVKGGTETKSYPVVGDITITKYTKALLVQTTCSVYSISVNGTCGTFDLDCKNVQSVKQAEKDLKDGTCSDQGYFVLVGNKTKSYPVIGKVTVTQYIKRCELSVQDTCTVFTLTTDEKPSTCRETDLDCKFVKLAKGAVRGMRDGNCASVDYTIKTGTGVLDVPGGGSFPSTLYTIGMEISV